MVRTMNTTPALTRVRPIWSLAVLGLLFSGCAALRIDVIQSRADPPGRIELVFAVDDEKGQPVLGLQEADFTIREDGQAISDFESNKTILPARVAHQSYVMLLLDMSGSMIRSGDLPALIEAATRFVETTADSERGISVGVFLFDGREGVEPLVLFTTSQPALVDGIRSLESYRVVDSSTNLYGATLDAIGVLRHAEDAGAIATYSHPLGRRRTIGERWTEQGVRDVAREVRRRDEARQREGGEEDSAQLSLDQVERPPLTSRALIVFTDGSDRASRADLGQAVRGVERWSDQKVFSIGLGGEIDQGALSSLGRDGFHRAQDASAVAAAFQDVAEEVRRLSQRYYVLAYCSPARAGEHELDLECESDGKSGRVLASYSAHGFGVGCDPLRRPPKSEQSSRSLRHRVPVRAYPELRAVRLGVFKLKIGPINTAGGGNLRPSVCVDLHASLFRTEGCFLGDVAGWGETIGALGGSLFAGVGLPIAVEDSRFDMAAPFLGYRLSATGSVDGSRPGHGIGAGADFVFFRGLLVGFEVYYLRATGSSFIGFEFSMGGSVPISRPWN